MDGMFAAIVVGTITFGVGGLGAAFILLLFFISSAILSYTQPAKPKDLPIEIRRDGLQVWANGFWFVIFLLFHEVFGQRIYLGLAAASVAVATADTWATEMGSGSSDSTYLITNFSAVESGTDGGISVKGTMAAFVGSALISILSIYVFSLQLEDFLYIFIGGFSGCLIDSYLGAFFQRNDKSVKVPALPRKILWSNNIVNWVSTGSGALLALILKSIFT